MSYIAYKWLVTWRLNAGYVKRRFTEEQKNIAWRLYYSKRRGRDCAIFRLDNGHWYRVAGFGAAPSA